jgi:hypothetical protein
MDFFFTTIVKFPIFDFIPQFCISNKTTKFCEILQGNGKVSLTFFQQFIGFTTNLGKWLETIPDVLKHLYSTN